MNSSKARRRRRRVKGEGWSDRGEVEEKGEEEKKGEKEDEDGLYRSARWLLTPCTPIQLCHLGENCILI